MPRPQTIVNVTAALPRRGFDSKTGTAMLVYAGATGSTVATRCRSGADATATGAPAGITQLVVDALAQGAPEVVLVKATAVDAAAVTETEWKAGLAKLTDEFGAGQVFIPGVTTAAAYAALLDHAAHNQGRCVLLDAAPAASAAALVTTATGLAAAAGSARATIVTGATLAGLTSGTTRDVPGSVIAAGLAARGDAFVGHANQAPIFDQGRGAGFVTNGVGVPKLFTGAELDTLHDAGVSVIRPVTGVVQLTGWVALSDVASDRQLNWGRMSMELGAGLGSGAQQFLGRQIDGRGLLFAELEGLLRGYLTELWSRDALYGASADEAFEVRVVDVNTPATAAAGQLVAAVEVSLSAHTETVLINVITNISEGIAA
jgi:hypothetical protein